MHATPQAMIPPLAQPMPTGPPPAHVVPYPMMLAPCASLLNLHSLDSAQLQSTVDQLQGELLATLAVLCFVKASLFLLLCVVACSN